MFVREQEVWRLLDSDDVAERDQFYQQAGVCLRTPPSLASSDWFV
jgi:hypothetical protein